MKKLLLAAALIAGSLTLVGNTTSLFAQGGGAGAGAGGGGAGAGGDVSTPRKSVPRVGVDKRDDSMNAGQRRPMRHVRHKKYTKHRRT